MNYKFWGGGGGRRGYYGFTRALPTITLKPPASAGAFFSNTKSH